MKIDLPEYGRIAPLGELAERLDRAVAHLDNLPRERLTADLLNPERPWAYGADYPGRWLEALSVASRFEKYKGHDFGIRDIVRALAGFQRGDGMLGEPTPTGLSSAARGLMGFVEAYETFGYPEAMEASAGLIKYYEKCFPPRTTQRACMGIRDIVRYAEVSGNFDALRLARRIYDTCTELGPRYPFDSVFGNFHMCIYEYRGLLKLYQHTGEEDLLDLVIAFQKWVNEHKAWLDGGVPEWMEPRHDPGVDLTPNADDNFFRPTGQLGNVRDETCTIADWMMLNLELGMITGNAQYVETAEDIFWNRFLANQADNGGWCAHGDMTGMMGEVWDACCSHHGTRALMEIMRYALIGWDEGLRLNMHLPVQVQHSCPKGNIEVKVCFHPDRSRSTVDFSGRTEGEFPFYLRRPRWAKSFNVKCLGGSIKETARGDIVITKQWTSGDRVECDWTPAITLCTNKKFPVLNTAIRRGLLVMACTPLKMPGSDTVRVMSESNEKSKRLIIKLNKRFNMIAGKAWVKAACTDWEHPEHGFKFRIEADDGLITDCYDVTMQGYFASQVFNCEIKGKKEAIITITSNSEKFPLSAARITSLRLFTGNGEMVFLDNVLAGGEATVCSFAFSEQALTGALSERVEAWPIRLEAKGCSFSLQPMKDLPRCVQKDDPIGQNRQIYANTQLKHVNHTELFCMAGGMKNA